MSDSSLVDEAYRRSLALLRRNLTPHGIMAASASPAAEQRNYTRIFGRDASICALGMLHSGDAELVRGAREGLLTLARHQADNGQIPNFVDARGRQADFWYVGCIDATLWWLIAVEHCQRLAPDAAFAEAVRGHVDPALHWLHCQEHPQFRLLQQNEASDWADIMPRAGYVLYSNALWYRVKQRYGLAHADDTRRYFNQLFFPFADDEPELARLKLLTQAPRAGARRRDLYLGFVNLGGWGEHGDVFGNLLALLFGLPDGPRAAGVLTTLQGAHSDEPYPVVTLLDPIREQDPLWRDYMARHRQNYPHQYHNGGVWPFIGGFWVMVLAHAGRLDHAHAALERLAAANALNDWQFNEWLHGRTGEPRGMPGQSWNAAMYMLAYRALASDVLFNHEGRKGHEG